MDWQTELERQTMLHCPLDVVFLKGKSNASASGDAGVRSTQATLSMARDVSALQRWRPRPAPGRTPTVVLVRAKVMADALGTSSTVMGPVFTGRSTRVLQRICQPQSP